MYIFRPIRSLPVLVIVIAAFSACSSPTSLGDTRTNQSSPLPTAPSQQREIELAIERAEQNGASLTNDLIELVNVVGQTAVTGDKTSFLANTEDAFKFTNIEKKVLDRNELIRSFPAKLTIKSIKFSDPRLLSDYDGDAMLEFKRTTELNSGELEVMKMNAYFRKETTWKIRWEKEIERIK